MENQVIKFIMIQSHDDIVFGLKDAKINWDYGAITGFDEVSDGKATVMLHSVIKATEISEKTYALLLRASRLSMDKMMLMIK